MNASRTRVALDASAVLAVLNAEPGADAVMVALPDAVILSVNYAEVVSKLVERGATLDQVRTVMAAIDAEVIPFDVSLAERSGALRATTKHLGLSLADRSCLALAQRDRVPVLTADRSWSDVGQGIEVRLIR